MRSEQQLDSNQQSLFSKHAKALAAFEILDDDGEDERQQLSINLPWQVLVVDDDEEVHASTEFALKGVVVLDRPIRLIHAYSAGEGLARLHACPQVAIILLDVVMESEDAGLKLVKDIRANGFSEQRIILRTGQPGYAPELSVLSEYDINDYRTKSELTRTRLVSLLTTSLRSYRQLHIINESRRGLSLIIDSASELFKRKNLEMFSQGVLTQLTSFLDVSSDGVVCLMASEEKAHDGEELFRVVTATGKYQGFLNQELREIEDPRLIEAFYAARQADMGVHINGALGLYFCSREGKRLFIYINICSDFSIEHIALLKIFASNIAIGFENLALIERLDQLAYIDSTLGIPNRNAFELKYDEYLRLGKKLSVVMLHVNGLNQLVSAFGVKVVNNAILTIRQRLIDGLKSEPLLIAYDGKADLILLSEKNIVDINEINEIFESSIIVDQFTLPFATTISIVDAKADMDAKTALRCATSAMIIAKSTPGTNVMHYDHSLSQGLSERILLQAALRRDLEKRDNIAAYLQPKVSCKDGKVIGAEALCRWKFEERDMPPADFIAVAEAGGLSRKITDCMLELVGDFARQRAELGLPKLVVAVNLSMHDLQSKNFAETIQSQCAAFGLSPETVEFEITESATMNNVEHAIAELEVLHKAGFAIAIDDFGTGYSSLNYLEKLPVSCLKIDKTFIDTLDRQSAKRSLVASAISIAELMGLFVIAEGIETKEQYEALMALNCDACQGYYFAKPIPMVEFNDKYPLHKSLLN